MKQSSGPVPPSGLLLLATSSSPFLFLLSNVDHLCKTCTFRLELINSHVPTFMVCVNDDCFVRYCLLFEEEEVVRKKAGRMKETASEFI